MSSGAYALRRELPQLSFDDAVTKVTEGLAEEGFGILTEIDVTATLKKKLDVDVPRYVILGACNPKLAHQALQAEPAIGVLLPCNVVVRERADGGSEVLAMSPREAFTLVRNQHVQPIAADVESRIQRVLDSL